MLGDVDVIGFCVPATEKVGPGDRRIAESLDGYRRAKKVAIVTKTDAASREQITERLLEVDALREDWAAVIPLSALDERAARRADRRAARAHARGSRRSTPKASSPTSRVDDRIAEIIREAALEGVRDELPHSIAVMVQDIAKREDRIMTDIFANVVVERDSQKAIIIGHKGSRLARRRSDVRARRSSRSSARRVYLSLHVRVAKEWQRDPKQLGRLGF